MLRPKEPDHNLVFVIGRQRSKRKVPVNHVPTAASREANAHYAAFTKALKSGQEAKYYDGVECEFVHVHVLNWHILADCLSVC
jgi:hypothetical protein